VVPAALSRRKNAKKPGERNSREPEANGDIGF
jgi:hypothetical protein